MLKDSEESFQIKQADKQVFKIRSITCINYHNMQTF